jgi:hypothetical protein
MRCMGGTVQPVDLIDARLVAFPGHEFVEDGKDLFAVRVDAPQIVTEVVLVPLRLKPLLEQRTGHVNVPAQVGGRVTTQKEPVKHCRFSLGSEWVYVISTDHYFFLDLFTANAAA